MKSQHTRKLLIFVFALLMLTSLVLVACTETPEAIFISVSSTSISKDNPAEISVKGYSVDQFELTVSDPTLVAINNGKLEVIGNVTQNTTVTVTATLISNPSVTASKVFTIIPTINNTITISAGTTDELRFGQSVRFFVVASNGEPYTLSSDHPELVAISNDKATVISAVEATTTVTVTATLNSDPSVKASCTITLAPEKAAVRNILIEADTYEISDKKNANIQITTSDGSDYTVSLSETNAIVAYRDGVLSIVETTDADEELILTVTLKDDATVKKTATFTVKAATPVPQIAVSVDNKEIQYNGEAKLTVVVTNTINIGYTVEAIGSNKDLVTIDGNKIKANSDKIVVDTPVTVKVSLDADPSIYEQVTIYIYAKRESGKVVGANGITLTDGMITAAADSKITVDGTLVDYYKDLVSTDQSSQTSYDILVKMAQGAWMGSWNISGVSEDNKIVITDNYRMGDLTGKKSDGQDLHYFVKRYIDMNNEVASKIQKDYQSVALTWESQHLWNHIGDLSISKMYAANDLSLTEFGYDATTHAAFKYVYDAKNIQELYLLTYFSYFLTPMLDETLDELYLVCDANGIVGIIGKTATVSYYSGDTSDVEVSPDEKPIAQTYTIINVKLSAIGTTAVPDPTPYTIESDDIFAETAYNALASAIEKMSGATNYTFTAVDQATRAPVSDGSDYEVESLSAYSAAPKATTRAAASGPFGRNELSATGTVGTVGYVTTDGIILKKTGKYDYSMDGKNYFTTYSGYKPFDGYYEEFAFKYENNALTGTRRVDGSLLDIIPQFNFAAEIFEWAGLETDGSKRIFSFRLRDSAIIRDVAMEVSMDSYATNANGEINNTLYIYIDQDGNLIKTTYPYSIVGGTYAGIIETTYSNFGTTTLPSGAFDDYVPRTVYTSWSQFTVDDYYTLHSTLCENYGCHNKETNTYDHSAHTATADKVLEAIFKEDASKVPTPADFISIFGDNIPETAVGFNWKEREDGTYADYFSFNTKSDSYDENSRITNFDEIVEALTEMMEGKGFTLSKNNTDISGGTTGLSAKYITFINGNVQIVIENIGTRYFYIKIFRTGDWTLKK